MSALLSDACADASIGTHFDPHLLRRRFGEQGGGTGR